MRLLILLLLSMPVFAGSYEKTITTIETRGTALGIAAAQHQFDMGTYSWQGSVAVGGYDSEHAISLGLGKRKCRKCPMVNGSIGIENGEIGYGAAVNFRF